MKTPHRMRLMRLAGASAVALSALVLGVASPASALCASATVTPCSGSSCCGGGGGTGNADFGVIDRTGSYQVGDTLTASQLTALGVNTATVDSYANGAQPTWDPGVASTTDPNQQLADEMAAAQADLAAVGNTPDYTATSTPSSSAAAGADSTAGGVTASGVTAAAITNYDVLWHWWDHQGHLVYYRRGYYIPPDRGFGDTKIRLKHGLDYRAAFNVTAYPEPGFPRSEGGHSRVFETPVQHVVCKGWWIFRKCEVKQTVQVLALVDYRRLRDGDPFGVVTCYAIGYDGLAPDWVRYAINR